MYSITLLSASLHLYCHLSEKVGQLVYYLFYSGKIGYSLSFLAKCVAELLP